MPSAKNIKIEGENPFEKIEIRLNEHGGSHVTDFCQEVRNQAQTNRSGWNLDKIKNIASGAVSDFLGTGILARAARKTLNPLIAKLPEAILNDKRQRRINRFFDENSSADTHSAQDPLRDILLRQARTMKNFSETCRARTADSSSDQTLISYGIVIHELEVDLMQHLSGIPAMVARAAVHRYNHAIVAMFAARMRDVIGIVERDHEKLLLAARPAVKSINRQPALAALLLEKTFLAINPKILEAIFETGGELQFQEERAKALKERMQESDARFSEIRQACSDLFVAAIDKDPDRVAHGIGLLDKLNPSYLQAIRAEAELGDELTDGDARALLRATEPDVVIDPATEGTASS